MLVEQLQGLCREHRSGRGSLTHFEVTPPMLSLIISQHAMAYLEIYFTVSAKQADGVSTMHFEHVALDTLRVEDVMAPTTCSCSWF